MKIVDPLKNEELLLQEYVAAKLIYKATNKLCKQLPDASPEKKENLIRLRRYKNKLDRINKYCLKHIDYYADLMDPELKNMLKEDDISARVAVRDADRVADSHAGIICTLLDTNLSFTLPGS
ncbi:MAG: hypothetical protein ACOC0R_03215 [Mariniphaga sp.]